MELNKYLDVSPEAAEALREGRPVVALESTIISHGMPYPQNVETALAVEDIVRANGAVPATCCVIGGRLKAGCTKEQIAAAIKDCGFDEKIRGEALGIPEFAALADRL